VQESLVAARDSAEQAASGDDVPWRYRAIVKRYFSPEKDSPRPER
jgi:hypothetical protein